MKYNKNEVTGKMRDRIILQNVNRSRSLTGFASESWADVATIWAFAESKLPGSNETIIEGKNTAKNICDFTIRYNSSITEESRVVWGDKLYQVKNLKVSHDRRFISFQGVFYDSYILTGINVAASVNGIGSTSANLKLIMSVIGQANAIASTFGELTVFQQGVIEVAASVNALGNTSANLTKVISISGDLAGSAFVEANVSIVQNIQASVQSDANVSANLKLTKTLASSVNATATATSILDVVTQGIVSLDASVTATGTPTANLLRIAALTSSPSTAADTSATATLTKVLEATATATAETDASAQLTIPVNASATATAETSANAQLTYTVNASATATAETSAEAQIVRTISASATAMAESSAEASFGVTFAASVEGTATVDNATIARAATMIASVTGEANVTGATLDVASSLILDLYPSAAVAYSLRKLRNAYTGSAIRVRRSSDNTEQDIGFVSGQLDTVSLLAFCGAGNGFVTTWYDQSGNARNATQATQANQPQIVSSGVVILNNSKPSLQYDGVDDSLRTIDLIGISGNTNVSAISVHKQINTASRRNIYHFGGTDTLRSFALFANLRGTGQYEFATNANDFRTNFSTNTNTILSFLIKIPGIINTTTSIYFNSNLSADRGGSSANVPNFTNTILSIGNWIYPDFPSPFSGNISEVIFYNDSQASNRTGIETNINTHYAIY